MARPQRSKRRKSLAERTKQPEPTPEKRQELAKKMCHDKKRYPFQSDARMAAATHNLSVYRCPVCHGWHLTSKPDL